jgi:hypothetical protein
MRESNLDPKKNGYYFEVARKCELFLQKKEPVGSLPFSNDAHLTSNSLGDLSTDFMHRTSDMKDSKDYGMAFERQFKNDKEKIIKYTYGNVAPDKTSTLKYTQLIIKFDPTSPGPKVLDMQIKSYADMSYFNLSPTEIARLRKKPEPVQPVAQRQNPVTPQKSASQQKKSATQQKKPTTQQKKPTTPQKKPATQQKKPVAQQKK